MTRLCLTMLLLLCSCSTHRGPLDIAVSNQESSIPLTPSQSITKGSSDITLYVFQDPHESTLLSSHHEIQFDLTAQPSSSPPQSFPSDNLSPSAMPFCPGQRFPHFFYNESLINSTRYLDTSCLETHLKDVRNCAQPASQLLDDDTARLRLLLKAAVQEQSSPLPHFISISLKPATMLGMITSDEKILSGGSRLRALAEAIPPTVSPNFNCHLLTVEITSETDHDTTPNQIMKNNRYVHDLKDSARPFSRTLVSRPLLTIGSKDPRFPLYLLTAILIDQKQHALRSETVADSHPPIFTMLLPLKEQSWELTLNTISNNEHLKRGQHDLTHFDLISLIETTDEIAFRTAKSTWMKQQHSITADPEKRLSHWMYLKTMGSGYSDVTILHQRISALTLSKFKKELKNSMIRARDVLFFIPIRGEYIDLK